MLMAHAKLSSGAIDWSERSDHLATRCGVFIIALHKEPAAAIVSALQKAPTRLRVSDARLVDPWKRCIDLVHVSTCSCLHRCIYHR